MKTTNISIRNSIVSGENYNLNIYFEIAGDANYLRIGDIITDSLSNKFTVISFENSATTLFQNGGLVTVSGSLLPTSNEAYNSTINSVNIPDFTPTVAWEAMISNVVISVPAYHYIITIGNIVTSDNGAGIANVDDLLIDGAGNVYIITTAINNNIVTVKELNELGIAPINNLRCFISRPQPEGSLLPQSLLERLETPVVRDKILNINSIYIWKNRGVKINENLENVTNITFDGAIIEESGNAWNGGKSVKVTVSGGSGTQGPQGVDGTQGAFGNDGVAGPQGNDGVQGINGVDGIQGSQGINGIDGVQGPQGIQGSTLLEEGQVYPAVYGATIDSVIKSINLFNYQEKWVSGTSYNKSDYVLAINSSGKYSPFFVISAVYPYVSTIEPMTDTDHWLEMSLGLNEQTYSFTNSNLNVGVLTLSNIATTITPTVLNDSNIVVVPDSVRFVVNGSGYDCIIDLTSQGTISGTWKIMYLS